MNQTIPRRLSLFVENTQEMRRGFKWKHGGTTRLAALLYTLENRTVNCERIRESYDLIRNDTGMFSIFRGNMSVCIAAMLSLNHSRERLFADTLAVYNQLKTARFRSSDYLAVAAYFIASNANRADHARIIQRAREFYDGMKKQRWFSTGQDDYIFSVMLALSDLDPQAGAARIEALYQQLKSPFWTAGGNSVQALAQMLALGGKTDEALAHLLALRDALRSRRIRLDKTYTLPSLGALSLLPVDGDILVNEMLEAQSYLRAQKGFGSFSISTQEILLFASAIILSAYAEEMDGQVVASISTSIASIIIAQQTAMLMAVIAANSAAASVAASS